MKTKRYYPHYRDYIAAGNEYGKSYTKCASCKAKLNVGEIYYSPAPFTWVNRDDLCIVCYLYFRVNESGW